MATIYFRTSRWLLPLLGLLSTASAWAQAPAVTRAGLSPAANARAASRTTTVAVPFSLPINASTAGNIKLFSSQFRGRRTATASVSSSTVTLTPTASSGPAGFRPGETLFVTVPSTVQGTGGAAAQRYVYQFTAATSSSSGVFAGTQDVSVGGGTQGVATGDVDGDGDLDLVSTSNYTSAVSIRLNDGTGAFTGSQNVSVGAGPLGVVLGDVDADGDLDLLTTNSYDYSVSIRLNDGTGAFTGSQNVGVGAGPTNVVLGDVDADGDLDLVTANSYNYSVSVRLNDGAGTFSYGADVAIGSAVQNVALGDVDADGDLDLLTANNYYGTVSVRMNDGAGAFSGGSEVSMTGPQHLTLGDVDADGDLDLVTANNYYGTASVRLNDGTGTFSGSQEITLNAEPQTVTLGDVDGDGDLDLLTTNGSSATVSVCPNNGAGTFASPQAVSVGAGPTNVALGDVDADGDLDILTANSGSSSVSVRLNLAPPSITSFTPGSGTVGTSVVITGTGFSGATAVKFNGVTAGYTVNSATQITASVPGSAGNGVLSVVTPAGTATSSSSFTFLPPLLVTSISPAPNALAASRSTAVQLTFSENITSSTAGNIKLFSSQYRGRRTATVSTSGNTVTLTPTASSGPASFKPGETVRVSVPNTVLGTSGTLVPTKHVYQFTTATASAGAVFVSGPDVSVAYDARSVAVGDVDGDGDLDLVMGNYNTSDASVRLNGGNASGSNTGTFSGGSTVSVGSRPLSVMLGDVDGDGDLDLLTANENSASVSVRLNGGNASGSNTGTFSGGSDVSVGTEPRALALGDIDGDGDLDMVVSNYNSNSGSSDGMVSVRLNNGAGTFTAAQEVSVGRNPQGIALGDADGDGDLDLFTANAGSNTVSLVLNGGDASGSTTGTFFGGAAISVGLEPRDVAVGDVDGDGDLDLLTANGRTGSVSVRLNNGAGTYSGTQEAEVASISQHITLGDIDGDGDLDFVSAGFSTSVCVRANDGTGVFSGSLNFPADYTRTPTLGDVDGDGDLDLLTVNAAGTVSVRLNQPMPTITSFTATSGAVRAVVTVTGTSFINVDSVSFNGRATTNFTVNSPTQLTVTVPFGATTGRIRVTLQSNTVATSNTDFTVLPSPLVATLSPARNARAAARNSPVQLGFSLPIDPATAGNIKVFSSQYRGQRTATVSTNGNTVTLTPTAASGSADFRPGETLFVSVLPTVISTDGRRAQPHVHQFTAATTGGSGTFANAPDVTLADYSQGTVLGDVDGDGDLDMLNTNNYAGTVSLRRNNGNGTFASSLDVNVSGRAQRMTLGDVDGDGDLDILTTSSGYSTNSVNVSLNNGTGTFSNGANVYISSSEIRNLLLADLDGDGDQDLVTCSSQSFSGGILSIVLNNGDGTFTPSSSKYIDEGVGMVVGDVDADGDLDLVVTTFSNISYTGFVRVLLNGGDALGSNTGAFTETQTVSMGYSTNGLALGDVDADGDLDLLASNGSTVSVLRNDGAGTFSGSQQVGSYGIQNLALGDADGDGDLDLFTTSSSQAAVTVWLNDGAGSYLLSADAPVSASNSRLTLGDVDGDGDLDFLASSYGNTMVDVRLNLEPPTITSFTPTTGTVGTLVTVTGTNLLKVGSVSFNGRATTNFTVNSPTQLTVTVPFGATTGRIRAALQNGVAATSSTDFTVLASPEVTTLSPARNARAAARTSTVQLGFSLPIDPATAGNIKVFSAQYRGQRTATVSTSGNTVTLTPTAASGSAGFKPGETVSVTVPGTVASPDGRRAFSQVYQFTAATTGGSGTFAGPQDMSMASSPYDAKLGDVDADGDLDLVTANADDQTVSIRLNDGTGTYSGTQTVSVGPTPRGVTLGDVDADGDLDMLIANFGGSTVSVRLNDGTGTFSGSQEVSVDANPQLVVLGDVDADGDLDFVSASSFNYGYYSVAVANVRLNDGAGNFSGTQQLTIGYTLLDLQLADIDGDGDLDILAATPNILVLYQNGDEDKGPNTGTFRFKTSLLLGNNVQRMALGDVDADGDLDVLVTDNYGPGAVNVRLNDGTGIFAGSQVVSVGTAPSALALGDVDGDGDLDFLAANTGDNTVSVRLNNGTGTFAAGSEVSVGTGSQSLALGDVDGDGDLDFLAASAGAGTVSARLNTNVSLPLPVELLGFTAQQEGSSALLRWATAQERDNDRFEVEASPDGTRFVRLGNVAGQGSKTSRTDYRFTDAQLLAYGAELVYYRLRQVDRDGTSSYSAVRSVRPSRVAEGPGLVLFPTIVEPGQPVQYRYQGPALPADATLEVFDALGRLVERQAATAAGTLTPRQLPAGWYQVRLRTSSGTVQARFYQP